MQIRSPTAILAAILPPLLTASCLAAGEVRAEAYPNRPITMIVPFPAGGPTDAVARIVADGMQQSLGKPVIISNIAGASGSIGGARGAHATPDGYTISFGTWSTHVVNGAVLKLGYDPLNDFEPVALISDNPVMLVCRNTVPARNVTEFVSWLQANPGKALSGTAGVATPPSIAAAFFQQSTKTRFQLIHYQTMSAAMNDLLADRIDLMFDFVANSMVHVQAGSIRPLAVLSKNRLKALPDVPTTDEAGLPGLYMSSWQAIWAPKGTPPELIQKLNKAVVDAVSSSDARSRLEALAQTVMPKELQTPHALAQQHKADIEKWWPIIRAANIQVQ